MSKQAKTLESATFRELAIELKKRAERRAEEIADAKDFVDDESLIMLELADAIQTALDGA